MHLAGKKKSSASFGTLEQYEQLQMESRKDVSHQLEKHLRIILYVVCSLRLCVFDIESMNRWTDSDAECRIELSLFMEPWAKVCILY